MTQFQQQAQAAISNQVAFTLSEKQYLKAMLLHTKTRRVFLPLMICVTLFTVWIAATSLATGVFMAGFWVLYLTFLAWMVRHLHKKQYQGMPQLHGMQTVQFSEEGLVWHNDYALSRVKWMIYQKYDADEDMYLLYQGPRLFNMIPRSAFADAEQESAFRALLELHVKPVAKASSRQRRREV